MESVVIEKIRKCHEQIMLNACLDKVCGTCEYISNGYPLVFNAYVQGYNDALMRITDTLGIDVTKLEQGA